MATPVLAYVYPTAGLTGAPSLESKCIQAGLNLLPNRTTTLATLMVSQLATNLPLRVGPVYAIQGAIQLSLTDALFNHKAITGLTQTFPSVYKPRSTRGTTIGQLWPTSIYLN